MGRHQEGPRGLPESTSEKMPPFPPSTAEFQKRECRSYLGENLKFMTSTRRKVAESVTQQVCQRVGLGDESQTCSGTHGSLSPERRAEVGPPRPPKSWTILRCWEAGSGLLPLWALVCSSVNGNDVPWFLGQLRPGERVALGRLCQVLWLQRAVSHARSHHPGI